jgi:hypothetical protein
MVHAVRSSIVGSRAAVRALVLIAVVVVALAPITSAQAHCDSRSGPVATAARTALETGDVTVILPYVQADAEAELTAAFERTLTVRELGGDAQALADEYFVETAVRLHRQGEGAPYTGLTDEETPEVITVADDSMTSGSLDSLYGYFDKLTRDGIAERYAHVVEAREHAAAEGTVAANRERAEAELGFELYVYGLYQAFAGETAHAEGGTHTE